MDDRTRTLRTCAFCPNTCRRHAPPEVAASPESHTPSALCAVALALQQGRLAADEGTLRLLGQRRFVQAVQPFCQYQLDIAGTLDAVVQAQGQVAT